MNIDKLMDLHQVIKKMPQVSASGHAHSYQNLDTTTRLPKSMILEELRVNERFLNESQSLVEDILPKKELDMFISYQNWNFKFGMGETKRNRKLYTDTTELTKENLFSNVNVKSRKELQKTRPVSAI